MSHCFVHQYVETLFSNFILRCRTGVTVSEYQLHSCFATIGCCCCCCSHSCSFEMLDVQSQHLSSLPFSCFIPQKDVCFKSWKCIGNVLLGRKTIDRLHNFQGDWLENPILQLWGFVSVAEPAICTSNLRTFWNFYGKTNANIRQGGFHVLTKLFLEKRISYEITNCAYFSDWPQTLWH